MSNSFYDLPVVGNICSISSPKKSLFTEPLYSAPILKIVTDNPNQFIKAHLDDAGYDIVANEDITVPGKSQAKLISTGLRVKIPNSFVGIIKSRSGLAVKHKLEVGAGVIDSGYTGEIKVLLRNFDIIPYQVKKGDKIAQMVVLPIFTGLVEKVDSLEATDRNSNGFNSTGY